MTRQERPVGNVPVATPKLDHHASHVFLSAHAVRVDSESSDALRNLVSTISGLVVVMSSGLSMLFRKCDWL